MGWSLLIEPFLHIIDKVIPDPAQKAEAQLKLMTLQQAGEFKQLDADLQMALGQMEINKVEAGSGNRFDSGWRPFLGWVCGVAFAMKYLGGPIAFMIAQFFGKHIDLPPLDIIEMMPVLFGMLGLGAYKTYEKVKAN